MNICELNTKDKIIYGSITVALLVIVFLAVYNAVKFLMP